MIKNYFQELAVHIQQLTAVSSKDSSSLYAKCLETLEQLKAENDKQLQVIYESIEKNPYIERLPEIISNAKKALEDIRHIESSLADPKPSLDEIPQPTDCSEPNCDDYPDQVAADAAHIAVATLEIVVAGAEAAKDLIPQTIAGFSNPAWIVAAALAAGLNIDAKIAAEVEAILQLEADKNDLCQENGYQTMLRGICNLINDIDETVHIIDGKVDYLIILCEDIKKTVHEISDRQIEQLLASCTKLVSLWLPVAFGGQLENVQRLVLTWINQSKAAGFDTCDAQSYYNQGVTAIINKEYKKAYQWFLDAYQELICCQ